MLNFIAYLFMAFYGFFTFLYAENYDTSDGIYDANFLSFQKNEFISQHGDLLISDIEVTGVKRTKKLFFSRIAKLKDDSKLSDFDPVLFVNEINKRGILAEISLDYKVLDGKAIIEVKAKDKWTLIPIPTISNSSSNSSFGLILLETNFLGLNKMFGAGAVISNNGNMFLLSYADQNIFATNFMSMIALITSTATLENKEWQQQSNDPYQEYKSRLDMAAYQLGYKFSSYFTPSVKVGYKNFKISKSYEETLNPPENASVFSYGINTELDFQSYHDYFKYGLYANFDIDITKFSSIEEHLNYNVYKFEGSYYHKLPNYGRLKFDTEAKVSDKMRPVLDQDRDAGSLGMYSLPSDTLLINDYANVTLTFEQSIYIKPWGMITASAFWEQGVFNGGFEYDAIDNTYKSGTSLHHYYAPGASVQLYFKDIAIPAIGFSYAYNMQSKEGLFKFVAGFAM